MGKIKFRISLVFFSCAILTIPIFYTLVRIQILDYKFYLQKSEKKVRFKRKISFPRGKIYDRNSNLLVLSIPYDYLYISEHVKNKQRVIKNLSRYFKISDQLNPDKFLIKIEGGIPHDILWELRRNKDNEFEGLIYIRRWKRKYLHGSFACHLIGFAGIDGIGRSGIELKYDKYLRGKVCTEEYFIDGTGREIANDFNFLDEKGCDVYLTIEKKIQYILEDELKNAFQIFKPKIAMGIIQNPSTGEIIAMASYPGFNPNIGVKKLSELKNPLVEMVFEPGSVFKTILLAASIDEGVFKRDSIIYCENGELNFRGHKIRDHIPLGNLTLEGILAYSSNIGMSKIGMKLGYEKIYHWVKNFGFKNYTGIDLPAELPGLFYEPSSPKISHLTPLSVSFGQEIGVTPIQIINAYSAIANGGKLYRPYVVKKIVSSTNKIVLKNEPQIMRKPISSSTALTLKEMLAEVVKYGTGKKINIPGIDIGGKTGTAQKIDPITRSYSKDRYIVSFCGFFPLDDPIFTILVIIDEPNVENYYASETAAPLFANIVSRIINYDYVAKAY